MDKLIYLQVQQAMRVVRDQFGQDPIQKTRKRGVMEAKYAASALLYHYYGLTMDEVGKLLEVDHSTITHRLQQHADAMQTQRHYKQKFETTRKTIKIELESMHTDIGDFTTLLDILKTDVELLANNAKPIEHYQHQDGQHQQASIIFTSRHGAKIKIDICTLCEPKT